ncbi:helix-turn-helix domain-containing protein [Mesorhizobium sp. 1M-11]|uniref:winged helix-turn-helix transcriptional regulator n=1 Tax=Mesorhizobium sp. 1M-11 TaxID=1529006 RepID=UPI0006C73F53|nr:helix-turn-helix domain-containing protein [Mesorhizobium sp. 1M-11]
MGRIRHQDLRSSPACPVEGTLELIGGKWKGVILYHLIQQDTLRFNELRRKMHVTQRMLTNQLRELEASGLIDRKVYAEVPPRVEYSLTDRGRSLEPIILALKRWGDDNILAMGYVAPGNC